MARMRERILAFVHALRAAGTRISLAESLDAVRAVAAVGVERDLLREALAAAVVKDERDRSGYDRLFDVHFPLVGAGDAPGRKRRRNAGGGGAGERGREPAGRGAGRGRPPEAESVETAPTPGAEPSERRVDGRGIRRVPGSGPEARPVSRTARVDELLVLPFRDFTARDV